MNMPSNTAVPLFQRFEGEKGKKMVIEALLPQRIVQHNRELASAYADKGRLVEYPVGSDLLTQGDSDNDILFLLSGTVEVLVNMRVVAFRHEGESIGEMSLLSPITTRSATVKATKPTLALRVDEADFCEIATNHPQVWKPIANTIADRLREREKFHRPPNPVPVLFIGSSVEGLGTAREIVNGLKHDDIIAKAWCTPGVFDPGGVTLDVLLKEVEYCDFAAFVFGPDDRVASRAEEYAAPRDNVIFEMGLFLGRLDRNRTFIIKDHASQIKIPSDLLGITPITYVSKPGQNLATTLSTVCNEIRSKIVKEGVR